MTDCTACYRFGVDCHPDLEDVCSCEHFVNRYEVDRREWVSHFPDPTEFEEDKVLGRWERWKNVST